MAVEIGSDRFAELVSAALDEIPAELVELIDNCVVLVEDEPPDGGDLLGLYDGIPVTERDSGYGFVLPDRILIFRRPILARCGDEAEVAEEVAITVVHEIAHHFGLDDDRLHQLGYG